MKHTKKNEQHIIPKTYLRYWKIEPNKNFVYGIDFSNEYKKGVQTFGLNDKVFKEHKYYNINNCSNPYILEDFFGTNIESIWNDIMDEINEEKNLSKEVREKIILWLYVSKMRSPYMRNNIERITNFIAKTDERYINKDISIEKEKQIESISKRIAKQIHLGSFVNKEQHNNLWDLFSKTLNAKQWRILKSTTDFEFWTNDNPGFSPNMDKRFAIENPYHHVIELNANSFIFFPLSPKYCLEISPFFVGTPLEISALNMKIEYEQADLEVVDYINRGIFFTKTKILVSNNKKSLEQSIRRN
ncbi:MAG: DUF4238 domain-containing protein [Bacteroidetes bacterium]|nr:DUF4238 domain-containing protein [Bacteroidota bacterium]